MTARDSDRGAQATEDIPVSQCEGAAETTVGSNHEHRPIPPMGVENDDHEEAGYGHGV